jgi:hypothetical protein
MEGRHALRVWDVRVALADHDVADGARVGASERLGYAVGEMSRTNAFDRRAGGIEIGAGEIVSRAVEASELDRGRRWLRAGVPNLMAVNCPMEIA